MEQQFLHYIEEDCLHRSIFSSLNRLEIRNLLKESGLDYQKSNIPQKLPLKFARQINPIFNSIFHLRLQSRFYQSITIASGEILALRPLTEAAYLILLGDPQTIFYSNTGVNKEMNEIKEMNETSEEEVIIPLNDLIYSGENIRNKSNYIHLREMKNGDLLYLEAGIIGTLNGGGQTTLILLF